MALTDVFLNQKRINICEHKIKMSARETDRWRHFYCVFTYIYSFLIKEDIWECPSLSVKFPRVFFFSFIRRSLNFFGKIFFFLFKFLCYSYFRTFPFHVDLRFQLEWHRKYYVLGHIKESDRYCDSKSREKVEKSYDV